jgi:hypothetical protein
VRHFARSTVLCLSTALLAAACDSSTGPADRIVVSTQGTSFQRGEDEIASIPWEIVNGGLRTVTVATCGDWPVTVVDRWQNGRWTDYYGGYCLHAAALLPAELDPGERLEGSASLHEPGVYRLRFGITDGASGDVDWGATSNAFEVE